MVDSFKSLLGVPAMIIDGLLYAFVALFSALAASFGTDEAAKYLDPINLFWLRTICTASGATALALKMFRSTSYADHQKTSSTDDIMLIQKSIESK